MSSMESTRPYHGHITNIWDEYAMNEMRHVVPITNSRPVRRPMRKQEPGEMERWKWEARVCASLCCGRRGSVTRSCRADALCQREVTERFLFPPSVQLTEDSTCPELDIPMLPRLSSSLPSAASSLARSAGPAVLRTPSCARFNSSEAAAPAPEQAQPKRRGVPLADSLGEISISARASLYSSSPSSFC